MIDRSGCFRGRKQGSPMTPDEAPAARPPDPLAGRVPGLRAGAAAAPHRMDDGACCGALGGGPADRPARRRGRRLPNPHLLIRPFVRREAVLSSRIEGTQATLASCSPPRPAPRSSAAPTTCARSANYVVALEYGVERLRDAAALAAPGSRDPREADARRARRHGHARRVPAHPELDRPAGLHPRRTPPMCRRRPTD